MPADVPKPDPIVIRAYLDDVDGELEAARRLSENPPSRFAAFHLQQAAETLVKAVMPFSILRARPNARHRVAKPD